MALATANLLVDIEIWRSITGIFGLENYRI